MKYIIFVACFALPLVSIPSYARPPKTLEGGIIFHSDTRIVVGFQNTSSDTTMYVPIGRATGQYPQVSLDNLKAQIAFNTACNLALCAKEDGPIRKRILKEKCSNKAIADLVQNSATYALCYRHLHGNEELHPASSASIFKRDKGNSRSKQHIFTLFLTNEQMSLLMQNSQRALRDLDHLSLFSSLRGLRALSFKGAYLLATEAHSTMDRTLSRLMLALHNNASFSGSPLLSCSHEDCHAPVRYTIGKEVRVCRDHHSTLKARGKGPLPLAELNSKNDLSGPNPQGASSSITNQNKPDSLVTKSDDAVLDQSMAHIIAMIERLLCDDNSHAQEDEQTKQTMGQNQFFTLDTE